MFDLEAVRLNVQLHQRNMDGDWLGADPVVIRRYMEKCPADASLSEVWSYWVCGRLASMRFETDPDEPLVGRVYYCNADPGEDKRQRESREFQEAREWLSQKSLLSRYPDGKVGQAGHMEPDYERVFRIGLDGIRAEIQEYLRQAEEPAKRETYKSFLKVLEAFMAMIERAAEAAGCPEAAERCRRIAHQKPETFREALQLIWFIDVGIMCGDMVPLVNPGRLDKRLISYYEHDLQAGTVTYESAVRDIALLYLYINYFTPNGLAYGVMVGGDTVNPLSYAALEALRYSRLVYPSVGVCANEHIPHDLKRLAVDIIAEGWPNPSFFNDSLISTSLKNYGVPEDECHNYINSTCVEITPCGASNTWVASPYFNLCGNLLRALKNDCEDFPSFMTQFYKELDEDIARGVDEQKRWRQARFNGGRRPLQSIFTRDCLKRGLDIEAGGAIYNWVECSFVGLANLVDSLIVVREEIFNQKNLTQKQMLELLENDFQGQEPLRQKFLNGYPKYGNSNPEVDSLIQPVIDHITAECAKYKMPPDDSAFLPGTFCWIMHQLLGSQTCATPDGRRKGFPFADGAGPAQGREKHGPTYAVHSVCSWNPEPLIGGCAFNMKYPKNLLASDETREKLLAVINAFVAGGGFQTQINVTDNELLKKAAANPEEYADLVVRIGGYTDYFVKLSPGMQQEVLLRTQYAEI